MGFYISRANSAGSRLSSSDTLLSPAPTYVKYPVEALGKIIETSDGKAIQQQPTYDNRQRSWVWTNYFDAVPGYTTLWNTLTALRSRARKEAGAVTPYVYVKDDSTARLRRKVIQNGTATAGGSNTLTDSGGAFPTYTDYIIEIIDGQGAGQVRTVLSNTSTQITVSENWSVNPNSTSVYQIRGWVDDWFRARVLDVSRDMREDRGTIIYATTTFTFVIDDVNYNDLG